MPLVDLHFDVCSLSNFILIDYPSVVFKISTLHHTSSVALQKDSISTLSSGFHFDLGEGRQVLELSRRVGHKEDGQAALRQCLSIRKIRAISGSEFNQLYRLESRESILSSLNLSSLDRLVYHSSH